MSCDGTLACIRCRPSHLQGNQLLGSIASAHWPDDLETIFLHNNLLSGQLPEDEALLPAALQALTLFNNSISGNRPLQCMLGLVCGLAACCLCQPF